MIAKKKLLILSMQMDGEKSLSNERKPMALVFAGPNGSGKSTITSYFDVVGRYTNADEMVKSSFISNRLFYQMYICTYIRCEFKYS